MSESRVREIRMHGLIGGRWPNGQPLRDARETYGPACGTERHTGQPAAYLTDLSASSRRSKPSIQEYGLLPQTDERFDLDTRWTGPGLLSSPVVTGTPLAAAVDVAATTADAKSRVTPRRSTGMVSTRSYQATLAPRFLLVGSVAAWGSTLGGPPMGRNGHGIPAAASPVEGGRHQTA